MKLSPGVNAKLVSMGKSLREEMEALLGPDGVLLYPSHPTVAPRHHSPICMPFNFAYTGEQLRLLCWGTGRGRGQALAAAGWGPGCLTRSVSVADCGLCSAERCLTAPGCGARIMLENCGICTCCLQRGEFDGTCDLGGLPCPQRHALTLVELARWFSWFSRHPRAAASLGVQDGDLYVAFLWLELPDASAALQCCLALE